MAKASIPIPLEGERALIVGQTGSGKTSFATYLLSQVERSPLVIYDTKIDNAFLNLPKSKAVYSWDDVHKALEDENVDYIVFRPDVSIANDPDAMDDLLYAHYNELHGIPAYIDEIYSFHNKGRSGNGLAALLTRGRSRKITTIMSTQRPAWISRFVITEAQKFYVFKLIDKRDKKSLGDVIPDFADFPNPMDFGFWYYKAGDDAPVEFPPVKLVKKTSVKPVDGLIHSDVIENALPDSPVSKINWI